MADRVQEFDQLDGAAALAELGKRPDDPGGRVGVLAAVLADAGQVALDVAGIERLVVERRGEQEDQPPVAIDQMFVDGLQRLGEPATVRPAPESTAHDWAIESIRQASFCAEPSGVPSSK